MHAIMGIIYGAFLAHLLPAVAGWARQPTGFGPANHGLLAWLLALMAAGVFLSGVRDLACALRQAKKSPSLASARAGQHPTS